MIPKTIRRLLLRGFSPYYYLRKFQFIAENFSEFRVRRQYVKRLNSTTTSAALEVHQALTTEGWAPLRFSPAKVERLVKYCRDIDLSANPQIPPESDGKSFWQILVNSSDAPKHPVMIDFATQPYFQEIAARYLAEKPVLSAVSLMHTFPTGRTLNHSQLWHLDADDTKVVIFYVYCNDVDESAGPFILARRDKVRWPWTPRFLRKHGFTDSEFQKLYEPKELTKVCGPSGTLFVCDTANTMHCGSRCEAGYRLAFTFRYSTFSGLYPVQPVLAT